MKIPIPTAAEIEQFWANTTRLPNGCWIYKNARKWYAKVRIGGISVYAHRLVAYLKFGEIPKGSFVCHHCDNPPCVNPDHLFIGTRSDNGKDAAKKRRIGVFTHPEQYDTLKCTPKMVEKIRQAVGSQREIAEQFGISQSHVCRIRSKKAWNLN